MYIHQVPQQTLFKSESSSRSLCSSTQFGFGSGIISSQKLSYNCADSWPKADARTLIQIMNDDEIQSQLIQTIQNTIVFDRWMSIWPSSPKRNLKAWRCIKTSKTCSFTWVWTNPSSWVSMETEMIPDNTGTQWGRTGHHVTGCIRGTCWIVGRW